MLLYETSDQQHRNSSATRKVFPSSSALLYVNWKLHQNRVIAQTIDELVSLRSPKTFTPEMATTGIRNLCRALLLYRLFFPPIFKFSWLLPPMLMLISAAVRSFNSVQKSRRISYLSSWIIANLLKFLVWINYGKQQRDFTKSVVVFELLSSLNSICFLQTPTLCCAQAELCTSYSNPHIN